MDEQLCLGIFRPDESTVLRCLLQKEGGGGGRRWNLRVSRHLQLISILCGEFLVVEFLKNPFSYAKWNFEPSEPHSLMKIYFYKNGVLKERHGEGS